MSGYHQHSFPPEDAYSKGLRYRFAIVLDTYRRSMADAFFDIDLFLQLVPRLCQMIGYDSLKAIMWDGREFHRLEDLCQDYFEREQLDCEPPERIELFQNEQAVGFVETELWTLHGGPAPYHDSYTFSCYTAEDCSEEFRGICEMECTKLGARTLSVVGSSIFQVVQTEVSGKSFR